MLPLIKQWGEYYCGIPGRQFCWMGVDHLGIQYSISHGIGKLTPASISTINEQKLQGIGCTCYMWEKMDLRYWWECNNQNITTLNIRKTVVWLKDAYLNIFVSFCRTFLKGKVADCQALHIIIFFSLLLSQR